MDRGEGAGQHKGSIIVSVTSARTGEIVQRHWLFDDKLTGYERELPIRDAFARACEELKHALK